MTDSGTTSPARSAQAHSDWPDAGFLTAALRSWLVNHLLSDEDLPELGYLLLELGYSVTEPAELKDFIKREMSRLAAGPPTDRQLLIRLCEGLIQFYLLHRGQDTPELDQLNRFLPPGLSFSSLSGRLLFVPEHYFQPHNLYVHEQENWYLGQQFRQAPARPELAQPPEQPVAAAESAPEPPNQRPSDEAEPLAQEAAPAPEERSPSESGEALAAATTSPATAPSASRSPREAMTQRGQQFRHIRQRRLEMLKHWGNSPSLEMEEST